MLLFFIGCVHLGIPMPGRIHAFEEGYSPLSLKQNGVKSTLETPEAPCWCADC